MNFLKRMLATCGFSAIAVAGVAAAPAQAQDYPTRNITMIVPFAAGGPTDVIARIVTGHMQQTLGQTIIIENVVGAGGTTASTRAAKAAPDGYTLTTSSTAYHVIAPVISPNPGFDPMKDFTHIAYVGGPPNVFVVNPALGVRSLKELIELGRDLRDDEITVLEGWAGDYYGIPVDSTLEAIRLTGSLEGVIIDPVYEGKSMAGLIDLVTSGDIPRDSTVLYAHLGGQPAINAYSALFR